MTTKHTFNTLIVPNLPEKVCSTDGIDAPGLGWKIDAQTLRDIEEIEANARFALLRAPYFFLD